MAGMIALIDYGAGNLRSVYKALKFVGADVKIVQRPEELANSAGRRGTTSMPPAAN